MDDLIQALQIFRSCIGKDIKYPTHCKHDVLHIAVDPELVSEDKKKELKKLSFTPDEFGGFSSFRFGSC